MHGSAVVILVVQVFFGVSLYELGSDLMVVFYQFAVKVDFFSALGSLMPRVCRGAALGCASIDAFLIHFTGSALIVCKVLMNRLINLTVSAVIDLL